MVYGRTVSCASGRSSDRYRMEVGEPPLSMSMWPSERLCPARGFFTKVPESDSKLTYDLPPSEELVCHRGLAAMVAARAMRPNGGQSRIARHRVRAFGPEGPFDVVTHPRIIRKTHLLNIDVVVRDIIVLQVSLDCML